MKVKLGIVGASYLQLPLVKKALELNIETHCFAWEEGAVCKDYVNYFYPISVTEKELILDVCEKVKIDGITTIASDLPVPSIAYVASRMGLVGNSVQTAKNSTNKACMRSVLNKGGVKIPKFQDLYDFSEYKNELNFPVVVKPVDSSGSRGVTKVSALEDLKDAFERAKEFSLASQVIIEEFIDGKEVSVEAISIHGKHSFLTVTDKVTTGEPFFVELAHHQPSDLPWPIQNEILKTTEKALNVLNIEYGASHTELKIDAENNIFIIEVGARMGGDFIGSHLVELSTGYDYLKAVIDVALNVKPEKIELLNSNNFSGVYFLCKETEYLTPYFNRKNSFDVEKEMLSENLNYIKSSNDRSGYLIYKSKEKIQL